MAITIVGTAQIGTNGNGGDVTLTFDVAPVEGDMVLVLGGHGNQNLGTGPIGPSTAGYTQRALYHSNVIEVSNGVWTKFMGATPDATVVCQGSGVIEDGVVYASIVLRGVDPTTPLDAVIVETSELVGGISTDVDLDAITTVTDGAWVIGGWNHRSTGLFSGPTGYSNFVFDTVVDTNRLSGALATIEVATAGVEDPPVFSGNRSDPWYGYTVAIRPAGAGGVVATAQSRGASRSAAAATFIRRAAGTARALPRSSTQLGTIRTAAGTARALPQSTASAATVHNAAGRAGATPRGQAAATVVRNATATASAADRGSAAATRVATATATGRTHPNALTATRMVRNGQAAGRTTTRAAATPFVAGEVTATAEGRLTQRSTAASSLIRITAAAARSTARSTAAGTVIRTGAATGRATSRSSATPATEAITAAGRAAAASRSQANGLVVRTATAAARAHSRAAATATRRIAATARSQAAARAATYATFLHVFEATGHATPRGAAAGTANAFQPTPVTVGIAHQANPDAIPAQGRSASIAHQGRTT